MPLIILIYCYGRILRTIKARIVSKIGGEDAQTAKFELAKNNVIKTLLIVAFFFVVCFLGNEVYYFLFGLGFEVSQNTVYYDFTVCMFFLNCTINPFIYLINYKDFQNALLGKLCRRISRQDSNLNITGSTISISVGPPSNGRM